MYLQPVLDVFIWGGGIMLTYIFGDTTVQNEPKDPTQGTYMVNFDRTTVLSVTSKSYLSVCIPPILMKDNFKDFEISLPQASVLLKGLSPGVVRVGGTEGDMLTFDPTLSQTMIKKDIGETTDLFPLDGDYCTTSQEGNADQLCRMKYNFTITGKDWDRLNEYAYKNGMKLLFGFNAIKRTHGLWDPHNAMEILNYTLGKNYQNNLLFELGNEPNSYKHKFNFTLSAHDHAKDFKHLYTILKSEQPYMSTFKDAQIVGPDITQPNKERTLKYLTDFLKTGGKYLDKITFHQYYISAKNPSTCVANFTDPKILDSLQNEFTAANSVVRKSGLGNKKVWMGETSTASGGGMKGVSDRYVAGFMWLDKLGMAAQNGIEVVVRQTFYSGSYALVDKQMRPNPDYWLSWVYKQLVGEIVLNVTCNDMSRKARIYAHCSSTTRYQPGSVTFYALNLHTESTTLFFPSDLRKQEKHVYLMEPHGKGGLTAKNVNLNGVKMKLINEAIFPKLAPNVLPGGKDVVMPPMTFAFIIFPHANCIACLHNV